MEQSIELRKQFVEIFVNIGFSPMVVSEIGMICNTDTEILTVLDFVEQNGEAILANPKAWEGAVLNLARQLNKG